MVLVFLAGSVVRGSRRWIDLGFFQFQPSEFGKLLFVLFLAAFLADRGRRIGEWRTVLTAVGLGAVPIGLVFAQPDFGTALVYAAALAAVLFVAGARWLHLPCLAVGASLRGARAALAPAGGGRRGAQALPGGPPDRLHRPRPGSRRGDLQHQPVEHGGRRRRPDRPRRRRGDTDAARLPARARDRLRFASLAEQRGFVGAAILLLLYLLVLWRGLRIIPIAADAFSAIVAGGIVFALLFQIFVNVGMTMGIAPITGIPLPFVCVGGSSMIANLLAVGVLQAIHLRGRSLAR